MELIDKSDDMQLEDQRLRMFAESVGGMYWVTSSAMDVVEYVSPNYEAIWGRSCQSLYDDPGAFLESLHPDDRERTQQSIALHLKNASPHWKETFRIIRPSGEIRHIADWCCPIWDDKKRLIKFIGISQDITPLKKQEAHQAEQERNIDILKSIFNNVPEAIIVANQQGEFLLWNKAAEILVGTSQLDRTPEERPEKYGTFFPNTGELIPTSQLPLTRAIHGKNTDQMEIFLKNSHMPAGVHMLVSGRPIKDKQGKITGGFIICTDITALKVTQAQLIQASKLASLGEMATAIAHEINQPLHVIGFSAQLLQEGLISNPTQQLTVIQQQIERTTTIIKHMRYLGRDSTHDEWEMIDLQTIIEDSLIISREHLKTRNIALHLSLCEKCDAPCRLFCNKLQLEQVFINLLGNAIDALSVESAPSSKTKQIFIRLTREGNDAIIEFEDTGPGIPDLIQQKVFEPFFTTKTAKKGTGLGLSVSHSIVKQHAGDITVQSQVGQGTCFKITLPLPHHPNNKLINTSILSTTL